MVDWLKRLPLKSEVAVDPWLMCIIIALDVVFGLVGLLCLGTAIYIEAEKVSIKNCDEADSFNPKEVKVLLTVFGIVCLFVRLPLSIISVRYKVKRAMWAYAVAISLFLMVQALFAILFFEGVGCFSHINNTDDKSLIISSIVALFLLETLCLMVAIFVAVKITRYPNLV